MGAYNYAERIERVSLSLFLYPGLFFRQVEGSKKTISADDVASSTGQATRHGFNGETSSAASRRLDALHEEGVLGEFA